MDDKLIPTLVLPGDEEEAQQAAAEAEAPVQETAQPVQAAAAAVQTARDAERSRPGRRCGQTTLCNPVSSARSGNCLKCPPQAGSA